MTTDLLLFDHLGIVVKRLPMGRSVLENLFPIENWTDEFQDSLNGVRCQFGRDASGLCYELLEPLGNNSPVFSALANGKAILNHVAYLVENLVGAGQHLQEQGCAPTADPNPAVAYGGCRIQFFVTPLRFIVELIEAPGHQHDYHVK